MKFFLAFLILIFSTTVIAQAQVTDSAKQKQATVQADSVVAANAAATEPVDDGGFLLFLLLYAMGVCAIIVVGIGVGIIVTIGALFIISALVTAGVFSASVIVAIYTRSLTKGFKMFFVTCSILAGGVFGAVALWVLNLNTHWHDTENALLMGGAFGLVAGLAGGMISFYFLQRLAARLRSKISIPIIPK
jgi:hypothetical protein